jgi:hypothetical protein
MNNTVAIVGIAVLVVYVAFRCVTFFGERLWKRSEQGHYDLAQEHFKELRAENKLRLVELLMMELPASEQRSIALDYVMNLTAYPDPESFEDIRMEVELRREARHLQVYGRAMTQEDRDRDAWAASMDRTDARRTPYAQS